MPPRLLLISREYSPFVGGGIGAYAARWARVLADRGERPVVVTTGPEGRMVEAEEDGATVIRLPLVAHRAAGPDWSAPHPAIATPEIVAAFRTFHPTSVFGMQVARALPAILGRHDIGAIEAPDTGAPHWFALNQRRCAHTSGNVAAWQSGGVMPDGDEPLRRLPIITHLHSPTEWIESLNGPEAGRQVEELRRMEADAVRWSDGLVCPSHALADWAARRWGLDRARIAVIPYPIGELAAPAPPMPPLPSDPSGLRLLFVGRLEKRKGVDTLFAALGAAAKLSGGRLPFQLDLAGRDTQDPATGELFGRAHFERLVGRELRAQVVFHGELEPGALRRLLAGAHGAIVPSPMDNFPNTCIEAMAAARPVVAARAGGAAEMIEDGASGLLFEPGDAAGLAGRLMELAAMAPEARARMGQAARHRICALCDDDTVLEARFEHLRSLAPPAPGERRREVVIVNRGGATDDELAPLVRAVACGEPRFAHGWIRDVRGGRSVIDVFGTPSADGTPAGEVGPIAIDRSLLEEAGGSPGVVEGAGGPAVADGPAFIRRLAGVAAGAVVPEAIIPTAAARDAPDLPFAGPEPQPAGGAGALRSALRRLKRRLSASGPPGG